jgi:hypothetical protein
LPLHGAKLGVQHIYKIVEPKPSAETAYSWICHDAPSSVATFVESVSPAIDKLKIRRLSLPERCEAG